MFAARSRVVIFLVVLLSSICFRVPAQSRPVDVPPRLVSAAEGEAIVQAAWELRRGLNPKPDCSHFVHAVYARAGFFYDYAASREILTGVSGFRRMRKPQAGDLVVWPGHMGIVIDPREHSFYSSVLSGFAIENYGSNYWLRRGNPRFYRFVVNFWPDAPWPDPSNLAQVGLASNDVLLRVIQPSPASGKSPASMATARPRASGLQSARIEAEPKAKAKANVSPQIKTQASAQTNANAPTQANAPTKASAPSPISAESSVQIQAPASSQMKPDASGQMKVEAKANVSPQIKTQASAQAKPSAPSPITAAGSVQIQAPASAQMKPEASGQLKAEASGQMKVDARKNAEIHEEVLVTSRPIPSRSEVLDAINRSADNNGERLLQNQLLDSQPSVGVVDSFRIVSLDFQGNVGLVDLEIKEIAAFRYGTARPYRLTALKRVILSRQPQGWILLDPQNLVYLNRRLAARALSHQLASMPPGPAGQQQVRTAAKILHQLQSADAGGSD